MEQTTESQNQLTFNGAISHRAVDRRLTELTIHTNEGKNVVVDFFDDSPANKNNGDEPGVYFKTGAQRTKIELSPKDTMHIQMLAGSLHGARVSIDREESPSGTVSETFVSMPLDMNVVDVNKDDEFAAQDVLNALSNILTKTQSPQLR